VDDVGACGELASADHGSEQLTIDDCTGEAS